MAKLYIDGVEYEFTTDFDLGEARIIKRYTGLTLNQIEGHDTSDPDLIAAFIHITLKRAAPETGERELEDRVNAVKLASLEFCEDEGVQASPPESAPADDGRTTGDYSKSSPAPSPESKSPELTGHPV